jgi:hypothetical protein
VFNQFGDLERGELRPGNVHSADGWEAVLKPVVVRYRGKVSRIYFLADAAFANPEVYEYLEAERIKYAVRLPANRVLQDRIGYLLKRPVGCPPREVRRYYANFHYQAGSWTTPRPVVAKVEWHPGELYPRVGFIVTNISRSAERVVAFYNKRGTAEQHIKEGKGAIRWTRLSCCTFAANAVRLQLHALAYNLGNFLRTLATPEPIKGWSLMSLKEKLVKIGTKVVSHGRYVTFQMAEVAVPQHMFQEILRRGTATAATASAGLSGRWSSGREQPTGGVRPNAKENERIRPQNALCRARIGRPDGPWGFGLQNSSENGCHDRHEGDHQGNPG